MVDWELHGMEFGNCNCAYGCGCQFNALPTHGHCQAVGFFRVDKGYFGEARLDGLNMALAVRWPGAVHQGHGVMQPIIDQRADEKQRTGLLSILTGKETDPMATFWAVYTAMCETILDPVYTAISIDLDMNARRAQCRAEGVATGRGPRATRAAQQHTGPALRRAGSGRGTGDQRIDPRSCAATAASFAPTSAECFRATPT
jgi:hypothetical protein